MLFLAAIMNFLWAYITVNKVSLFYIFLGRAILGYIKAIVWDSNNLFLSEKYSEDGGVINAKYLHIFRYFISSVFIVVS